MRVVVTGISGFVGEHLATKLRDAGHEIYGICGSASSLARVQEGGVVAHELKLGSGLLAALEAWIQSISPEVVFHLAGISSVPEAESDFSRVLNANVLGSYEVLAACRSLSRPVQVVLVSSGEVHRDLEQSDRVVAVTEESPFAPQNNYGLSKVLAEQVATRFARDTHLGITIFRPFNHIGPGQSDRFVVSSFARQLAQIKLGRIPPEIRVGNLDAERDFLDVRDVVAAYVGAIRGAPGVFLLGSGMVVSIREILELLIDVSETKVEVVVDPARCRRTESARRGVVADARKAREFLGWRPEIPLKKSLRDIFSWWLEEERRVGIGEPRS